MTWRALAAHVLAAAALLAGTATAARDGPDEALLLAQLAEAARGQTLVLAVHGVAGHEATVREFQRRFPQIRVELTVQNPSSIAPRIVTEQKNGVFAWDSWWAASTAMNNIVLPADGFDPIANYLVLPTVKDPRMWYASDHRYTSDARPFVILHSLHVETGVIFNRAVVRGLRIRSAQDLLDPRLKGLIAIRDPSSGTTSGSYVLAELLKRNGPEFIRRLIIDQKPAVIENARQLNDAVLRGDYAVSLGSSPDILSRCHKLGGCRQVMALPIAQMISSRGVGVLRHPPHPAAARLWVNWLLSREGQQVYVREWARDQSAGATSLRRDVAPDPAHVATIPDYAHLDRYGLYGFEAGRADLEAANRLVAELRATRRNQPPTSAIVISLLALVGVLGGLARLVLRGLCRRRSDESLNAVRG
jgi:iron(III) transport system substrate-binding protein